MIANVPCINSALSVYMSLDRPVVYGALAEVKKKHGEKFPLIDLNYFSSFKVFRFPGDLPLVAKVGHAEAGYGKMKVVSEEQISDLKSVLALNDDYSTTGKQISFSILSIHFFDPQKC